MNDEVILLATRLETRSRQLILQYQKLQEKLAAKEKELSEQKEYASALEEENQELRDKYEHLKMAKYIDMADDDMHTTKNRINRMLHAIDRCISILQVEK